MFDEYLNHPPCVNPQVPATIAPEPAVSTGTPSSTTIDQDAPSISNSQTPPEIPSPLIPLGVEEANHDIKVVHMNNNPFVEFLIPEPSFEESSTQVVIPNHVNSINQPPEHINKWTKDHPIDNVIGDPSRPVSTRQQLQDEALFYYFDAFLYFVEPKSYKDALTESCWIEAISPKAPLIQHCSSDMKRHLLNQSKYALESLKKYGMETCDPTDTPMVEKSKLDEDPQGKAVDPTRYRGMIGTLMYLTSNRPYLVFTVCMCARYQAKPTEKN
ncbi:hypothetical protein Tco_1078333 [Tanacetum coccineum]